MSKKAIAALVLATASGIAFAALPAFETVDTNGDGMITKEEAAALEGLDFDAADANENGSLDKDEYEAASKAM